MLEYGGRVMKSGEKSMVLDVRPVWNLFHSAA